MVDNYKKVILSIYLLLAGIQVYGQNEIKISYQRGNSIENPFKTLLFLKSPDGKSSQFTIDTASRFVFSQKHPLTQSGKYTLSIQVETKKGWVETLDQDFDIVGNELLTEIDIHFTRSQRTLKKVDKKQLNDNPIVGFIEIVKYYEAPKSIRIQLDKEFKGNEYMKGPFFRIKNNSMDTLYGEHLPGYFWGSLSLKNNDSIDYTIKGTIDYNFADIPPLYPDSSTYASVGSFGHRNILFPSHYQFELNLFNKLQIATKQIPSENKELIWYVDTNQYWKLKYDFEIEE
jgi:hypothetical protein